MKACLRVGEKKNFSFICLHALFGTTCLSSHDLGLDSAWCARDKHAEVFTVKAEGDDERGSIREVCITMFVKPEVW